MQRAVAKPTHEVGVSVDRLREAVLASPVLVVEDDLVSLEMLIRLFTLEGFTTIRSATNGQEALDDIALGFIPALVVSDIKMPGMDGFELCKRLRGHQDQQLARVPILVQTALKDMKDKANIFAAGATDYLTKPVDPNEITTRSIVHLEREIVMRRLMAFSEQLARVPDTKIAARSTQLQGDILSFKAISSTLNLLLDEIERNQLMVAESLQRAVRAEQAKASSMKTVSAELKTPIADIRQGVALCENEMKKGRIPSVREHLAAIGRRAHQLEALANDLADFSWSETHTS